MGRERGEREENSSSLRVHHDTGGNQGKEWRLDEETGEDRRMLWSLKGGGGLYTDWHVAGGLPFRMNYGIKRESVDRARKGVLSRESGRE